MNLKNVFLSGVLPSFVGFAVCALGLMQLRPGPLDHYVPVYSNKCIGISNELEPVDVVFIGSSRMFNGIMPEVIERELSSKGIRASVWNLSLHDLSNAEQKRIIEDLQQQMHLKPKLIVYEPCLRLGMELRNSTTSRSVYFSNLDSFLDSARFIQGADRGLTRKTFNQFCNVTCFVVGATNYGSFSSMAFPNRDKLGRDRAKELNEEMKLKGFTPADQKIAGVLAVESKLKKVVDQANADEQAQRSRNDLLPSAQWELFLETESLIKSHGCDSIAVVMPKFVVPDTYYREAEFQTSRRYATQTDIDSIDYLWRSEHPELYQIKFWHDKNHLSQQGADFFSREIAAELATRLARKTD